MVKITKQLSVFLENRPGALAKICGVLAEAKLNVLALSVHDTVDHAIVRLIVDQYIKALLLLEQQGLYILEQDVVLVSLDNRPGNLAELAQKLARADVNIEYAYCTAIDRQEEGCLVLKTDSPERTVELLRDRPE
jgi:hypothetical protein